MLACFSRLFNFIRSLQRAHILTMRAATRAHTTNRDFHRSQEQTIKHEIEEYVGGEREWEQEEREFGEHGAESSVETHVLVEALDSAFGEQVAEVCVEMNRIEHGVESRGQLEENAVESVHDHGQDDAHDHATIAIVVFVHSLRECSFESHDEQNVQR